MAPSAAPPSSRPTRAPTRRSPIFPRPRGSATHRYRKPSRSRSRVCGSRPTPCRRCAPITAPSVWGCAAAPRTRPSMLPDCRSPMIRRRLRSRRRRTRATAGTSENPHRRQSSRTAGAQTRRHHAKTLRRRGCRLCDQSSGQESGAKGSWFDTTEAGLSWQSDWNRNDFHGQLKAGYTDYFTAPEASSPYGSGTVDARVDATRDLAFDAEGRFNITPSRFRVSA